MPSLLPDSRNLEAGIVEDPSPSRLSRVHDNVRDLLRRSVFGSVSSSPRRPAAYSPCDPPTPISPILSQRTQPTSERDHHPVPIGSSVPASHHDVPGVLFPPWRSRSTTVDHTIRPYEHPDLPTSTLSAFLQQKDIERQQRQQEKAWKRPKARKQKQSSGNRAQWPVCAILAVILLGLLGTCKHHTTKQESPKV